MTTPTSQSDFAAFVKKHKVALIIGGVVIALFSLSDDGTQQGQYQQPPYAQPGGGQQPYQDPYYQGGGGDDQYESWRRRQEEQDAGQERFVDEVIREVQTCTTDDGTVVYDVPVDVDCENVTSSY
ncbi:MAG: hypothetical protein AAF221_01280 [Pseudomonadota bacterium]